MGDNGWDQVLAHVRLEAEKSDIRDVEGHLLFLIRAAGPKHAERFGLPQASPDCAKDGGRESHFIDRSDVMLVHQAPRSLFGRPVVTA